MLKKWCDSVLHLRHWLLRLPLISVFLFHSVIKLLNPEKFSMMMDMDVNIIYIVAIIEMAAVALLTVGGLLKMDWATRLSGVFFTVIMLGSLKLIYWGQMTFMPTETHPWGLEYQMVMFAVALYFIISGNHDVES